MQTLLNAYTFNPYFGQKAGGGDDKAEKGAGGSGQKPVLREPIGYSHSTHTGDRDLFDEWDVQDARKRGDRVIRYKR
ncbi:MAG: hypothetical protein VKJ04_07870 [Vampirovibrionales bacterium]|nr:hypothetical protein [Vampirovibrionales bacterium]